MDCLRSFSFGVSTIQTLVTPTDLKQWTVGTENYWQALTNGAIALPSIYNMQGYTNIDIYGIDVIGDIQTQTNTGVEGCIVDNWTIDVITNGQHPLIGGSTTGGFYTIDYTLPENNIFALGKYTNSVKFASPIISPTAITLGRTRISGHGWQTAGSINLFWRVNFIVYYQFQGE